MAGYTKEQYEAMRADIERWLDAFSEAVSYVDRLYQTR